MSATATAATDAVLARMRRNPVALRVSEIAQGAGVDETDALYALVELAGEGLVEPAYWRLTAAGKAEV